MMELNSTAGSVTPSQQFSVADLVVVVVYFSLNVAVGIWVRVFCSFLPSCLNSFLFRAGFSVWNFLNAFIIFL